MHWLLGGPSPARAGPALGPPGAAAWPHLPRLPRRGLGARRVGRRAGPARRVDPALQAAPGWLRAAGRRPGSAARAVAEVGLRGGGRGRPGWRRARRFRRRACRRRERRRRGAGWALRCLVEEVALLRRPREQRGGVPGRGGGGGGRAGPSSLTRSSKSHPSPPTLLDCLGDHGQSGRGCVSAGWYGRRWSRARPTTGWMLTRLPSPESSAKARIRGMAAWRAHQTYAYVESPLPPAFWKRLSGRRLWPELGQAIGSCAPPDVVETLRGTRSMQRTPRDLRTFQLVLRGTVVEIGRALP
mmetsp:Transcript_60853/g.164087  ORF Transcript_60853/g.164087 Transcript_60853/m.164087 type:complete len:299 (+) Transcript_60853:338-1234(+)